MCLSKPLLLALFTLASLTPLKGESGPMDEARASGAPSSQRDPKSDWLADFKKHLPGWLSFGGQYRGRVEGQTGREFIPGNDDFYYLSQLRLDFNIRVCSSLRLMVQGQDSHAPGLKLILAPPAFKIRLISVKETWTSTVVIEDQWGFSLGVRKSLSARSV